jgi:hypothetical protein
MAHYKTPNMVYKPLTVNNTFAIFLLGASVDPVMSQGLSKNTCELKSAQGFAERFFILSMFVQ